MIVLWKTNFESHEAMSQLWESKSTKTQNKKLTSKCATQQNILGYYT